MFMDDEENSYTRTRERTANDAATDDILGPRDAQLPILSPTAQGPAFPPEFAMALEMGRGRTRDDKALARSAQRIGERMGSRAIYSFPVGGGKRVEGPTVHLVEALAQNYGSLFYGVRIESVEGDRVVIMGLVADAITGTVAARPAMFNLPPAPGKFAEKPDQVSRWESMQVQNAISKATRGVLQHALPRWYIDIAYDAADRVRKGELLQVACPEGCRQNHKHRDTDETFAEAVDTVVAYARESLQISLEGLEAFVGSPRALWVISDLFALRDGVRGVKTGGVSREAFAVATAEPTKPQNGTASLGGRGTAPTPPPPAPVAPTPTPPTEPTPAPPPAEKKPRGNGGMP